MTTIYASGRQTLSQEDWSITKTATEGELTSKTLYFSLQTKNNSGYNIPIVSSPITIDTNDKVTVTLEDTIRKEGEGWLYAVICCGFTDDPAEMNQIAKIPLYGVDQFGYPNIDDPVTYPITIDFSYDHQLSVGELVDTVIDLPSVDLINGIRYAVVEKDNNIYELDVNSVAEIDNDVVLDAAIGRWILTSSFSNDVTDVTLAGGCNVNLLYLSDFSTVELPTYDVNGAASPKMQYWIINDTGVDIEAGQSLTLNVDAGGYDKSKLFDNKITYIFHGFANVTTGELRTTYDETGDNLLYINLENDYSSTYPSVAIEDTLKNGEALFISLFVKFDLLEVQGKLPNTTLSIFPELIKTSGTFNPLGTLFEKGIITKDLNRLRVYPDEGLAVKVKSGSGIVRNYSFWKPLEQSVIGLTPNATNEIYVDKDGGVYLDTVENNDSVLRAIVKTLTVESKASVWSTYTPISLNSRLQITVVYPCNADLVGTIRANYPDVIAGTESYFNVRKINIYVQRQSDNEIRKFTNIVATPIANQIVTLSDWSSGTVVTELPFAEQGLFNPATITVADLSNGGNMTATNYRVAYTLVYDGTVVSDIDHSSASGCITEVQLTGEDLFGTISFNTLAEIRNITTLYDGRLVYCKQTNSAYFYNSTENTSDDGIDYIEPNVGNGCWINVRRDIVSKHFSTNEPSSTDDVNNGFSKCDVWLNTSNDRLYFCVNNESNNAIWKRLGSGYDIELTQDTTWYIALDGTVENDGLTTNTPINWTKLTELLPTVKYNCYNLTLFFKPGYYDDTLTELTTTNFYLFSRIKDGTLTISAANWVGVQSTPFVTFDFIPVRGDFDHTGNVEIKNVIVKHNIDLDLANNVNVENVYFDLISTNNNCIVGTNYTKLNVTGLIKFNTDFESFVNLDSYSKLNITASFDAGGNTINIGDAAYVLGNHCYASIETTLSGSGSFVGKRYKLNSATSYIDVTGTPYPGSLNGEEVLAVGTSNKTLKTVAFTNSYNDLNNKPTLGTSAALNIGVASGVCPLDSSSKVPTTHLPSYVDTAVEYANLAAFPVTGEAGTVYVALDTNKVYRWSGSTYIEISNSFSGDYADLTGKPTLGTAAALDVGTTANKIVQLDENGKLPALDGSQLTGIVGGGGGGGGDLPSQTGNENGLLTTNGTNPNWTQVKTVNGQSILGSGDIQLNATSLALSPIKTSSFTTVPFYRYPLDSSGDGFIITLHNPSDGDIVGFYDATANLTANPVSITGNKQICGFDTLLLSCDRDSVELIYSEDTDTWSAYNSQTTSSGGGSGGGGGDLTSINSQINTINNQILGLQTTDTGLLTDVETLQGNVEDLLQTVGALGNFSGSLKPLENVYIAPDNDLDAWTNGVNAITYAQYKANQAEPDPQDRWQTSDPNGANFRAFTLSEAAKYCNENISPDGLATLYLKAGIYYINATFNCSVLINGCENNGTVGDYKTGTPNTLPTNSVIFYQKFEPLILTDSSDGQLKIRAGSINGSLTVKGKSTSTIKNCHFWSCTDWLEYQDKTIEDVFIESLADQNVTDSWNGDSMSYALNNEDYKVVIENGSLITDGLVTVGACCPSGNGLPFKSGPFLIDNGKLIINSIRLRGNMNLIYPVSVYDPVGLRNVMLFDDDWDGWAKCDSTGNLAPIDPITEEPIDPDTLTYRCASGFAQSLITFRGDCELRLGGARYSISVLSGGFGSKEVGIDQNCVRLESVYNGKFGSTDTNAFTNVTVTPDINWQGSDNLGVEGASVFYSDDKSPSIRYLINIDEADSRLRLQSYCWDKQFSISCPGFRGVFGSVYTITDCDNAGIIYSKPQSLNLVPQGFGVTLDRDSVRGQLFNTIWVQRSNNGSSIPSDPATIELNLKIKTTQLTQRFYLNNELCTNPGSYNGTRFTKLSIVNNFTW